MNQSTCGKWLNTLQDGKNLKDEKAVRKKIKKLEKEKDPNTRD